MAFEWLLKRFGLTRREKQASQLHRRRVPIPDKTGRYSIPAAVLTETLTTMREFGSQRRECYFWWGGYFTAQGNGQVLTALFPDVPTTYGTIHLKNEILVAMQNKLRQHDQILLAELHTHPPGAGGQNDVDAANPASPYPGFISIVVPDFGAVENLSEMHVYEYLANGLWRTLSELEIQRKFTVEPVIIPVQG